jgi:hypothetical protein
VAYGSYDCRVSQNFAFSLSFSFTHPVAPTPYHAVTLRPRHLVPLSCHVRMGTRMHSSLRLPSLVYTCSLAKPILSVGFLEFALAFVSILNLAPLNLPSRTRHLLLGLLLPKVGSPPAKPRLKSAPHTTPSCMYTALSGTSQRGTSTSRRSRCHTPRHLPNHGGCKCR